MRVEYTYSASAKQGKVHDMKRWRADRGQGFLEYALIILFVAIAVVAAVTLLGPTISSIFALLPPAL
jgi:Flp pilus assembly pilin Flp